MAKNDNTLAIIALFGVGYLVFKNVSKPTAPVSAPVSPVYGQTTAVQQATSTPTIPPSVLKSVDTWVTNLLTGSKNNTTATNASSSDSGYMESTQIDQNTSDVFTDSWDAGYDDQYGGANYISGVGAAPAEVNNMAVYPMGATYRTISAVIFEDNM